MSPLYLQIKNQIYFSILQGQTSICEVLLTYMPLKKVICVLKDLIKPFNKTINTNTTYCCGSAIN